MTLDTNTTPNTKYWEERLHAAASEGDNRTVRKLLTHCISSNARDFSGASALAASCSGELSRLMYIYSLLNLSSFGSQEVTYLS